MFLCVARSPLRQPVFRIKSGPSFLVFDRAEDFVLKYEFRELFL